ncbi:MAG: hypothetical protein ACPG9K_00985 [Poseidonibacter sp.]
MKIGLCNKICKECGFIKKGTKDTLYAEAKEMFQNGAIFPCHLYLKSQTGSENIGTEKLKEIKVCRGYVSYVSLHHPEIIAHNDTWKSLFDELNPEDFLDIYEPEELEENHIGLKENIFLGN